MRVLIRKDSDTDKQNSEKFPLHFLPVLLANGDSNDGVRDVGPAVCPVPEDQLWVELISPGDGLSLVRFISATL